MKAGRFYNLMINCNDETSPVSIKRATDTGIWGIVNVVKGRWLWHRLELGVDLMRIVERRMMIGIVETIAGKGMAG